MHNNERFITLTILSNNQRFDDLRDSEPCEVASDTEQDAISFFVPRSLDVHVDWWADNDPMNNTFTACRS